MPMPRTIVPRLLTLAMLCGTGLAALAGEVHVWKDSSGRTHYSDLPPPPEADAQAVNITVPQASSAPAGSSGPRKSLAEQELEFRQRRAARTEQEDKQAEERARKEKLARQCADARNQLAALESGRRVAKFNDRGEREILDDDQRSTEAARIRESIEEHCK